MLNQLLEKWHLHFGETEPGIIVRAPGRVNIIGEHTDYNEGFVMPGAMSKAVYILMSGNESFNARPLSPLKGERNHWISFDFKEEIEFEGKLPVDAPLWSKYVQGAMEIYYAQILKQSHLLPFSPSHNLLIGGDLPIGSGVSSSSSLVCGILFCLDQWYGSQLSKQEMAILGSRVEREIIGLQGGIMDQFAIMLSQKDHVMMLDCRDRSYKFIPASLSATRWVLINTKVKHQLIDSDYNQRAKECQQSVDMIKNTFPQVQSLRDVTIDILSETELPEVHEKRCRFVIEENRRVEDMVTALNTKDPVRAGELLKASHQGLQYLYEVSCEELDHLAEIANNTEGVFGGRMMGGGFGGCVICLVRESAQDVFLEKAMSSYEGKFGFKPEVIEFDLSDGVSIMHNPLAPNRGK
jgi:galactokinase